nr:hypothetical protein [Polyangiaceae bacterium]
VVAHQLADQLGHVDIVARQQQALLAIGREAHVARREGKRLVLARKLRGARGTSANLELMSSLLIRCAERAERRALASELRGSSATRTARALGGPGSALFLGSCLVLALGAHWMAR